MRNTRSFAALIAFALSTPALAASADPLAGTWRLQEAGNTVELTLDADGRFARRDLAQDGEASSISGRWTISGTGPWLHLHFEDWAPRQACGLIGCTAIRMPAGETYRMHLEGGDLLLLDDAGGRLALRRAG